MKPAPFEYHAPETVDDAVGLLAQHGDDAKPLAGGQSLVPLLSLRLTRFDHLVDLNRIGALQGIRRENGHVVVGAMTRHRAVELDPSIGSTVPLLAAAVPWIGHFQIRNRGTIGGSIAHADPAAELPAVAAALDAEMEITSKSGVRRLAAADFFQGTFMTAIDTGELLTAIRFPVWGKESGFAFTEFARRSGDFAIAGVGVGLEASGGTITRAAIAFMGMGPVPARAADAEKALLGVSLDSLDAAAVARIAVAATDATGDVHASAANRTTIATHLAEQALTRAASLAAANV